MRWGRPGQGAMQHPVQLWCGAATSSSLCSCAAVQRHAAAVTCAAGACTATDLKLVGKVSAGHVGLARPRAGLLLESLQLLHGQAAAGHT